MDHFQKFQEVVSRFEVLKNEIKSINRLIDAAFDRIQDHEKFCKDSKKADQPADPGCILLIRMQIAQRNALIAELDKVADLAKEIAEKVNEEEKK